jgi:hypothetical protein
MSKSKGYITVKIKIGLGSCLAAIQYQLLMGFKIKSKVSFNKALSDYFEVHGRSNISYHETESKSHFTEASKLIEKYF